LSRDLKVGVLGATGAVGREVVRQIEERSFPAGEVRALASRSGGRHLTFRGREIGVQAASGHALEGLDLVFSAVSSSLSRALVPSLVSGGAVVIDKSAAFRLEPDVPLVVPEVNGHALHDHRGIVASPNCSTTQLVVALRPLQERFGLERVVVTTYQSVSGAGQGGLDRLREENEGMHLAEHPEESPFPRPIARNLFPQIGDFDQEGYCTEENKMSSETQKILGLPDLPVSVSVARVPVQVGHCEAVWVKLARETQLDDVVESLCAYSALVVEKEPAGYMTPVQAAGRDEIFVGRVRADRWDRSAFWLWVVADNLRKGAATNALQIAEELIRRNLV